MPFEHGFSTENANSGPHFDFVTMTLPCFTSLPFSNICKNKCQRERHGSFYVTFFSHIKMADAQEFLLVFGEFLRFFMLFYFIMLFSNGVICACHDEV